jgi:hypothetical protein
VGKNSKIGWTHDSMSFWWGCDKVSNEYRFCYIGPIMRRGGHEPFGGPLRTKDWSQPRKWVRPAGMRVPPRLPGLPYPGTRGR